MIRKLLEVPDFNKNYLFYLFLSSIFFASSILKFIDIVDFFYFILETFKISENYAFVVVILTISIEIVFGLMLIFNIFVSELVFVIKLYLIILSLFVLYLFFFTNIKNCYCFGNSDSIFNSLGFSLIKNTFMIFIVSVIKLTKEKNIYGYLYCFISIITIFCLIFYSQIKEDILRNNIDLKHGITYESLLEQYNTNNILFIDLREYNYYKIKYLDNAVNIPSSKIAAKNFTFPLTNDSQKIIVLYCYGSNCSISKKYYPVFKKHYTDKMIYYLNGDYTFYD